RRLAAAAGAVADAVAGRHVAVAGRARGNRARAEVHEQALVERERSAARLDVPGTRHVGARPAEDAGRGAVHRDGCRNTDVALALAAAAVVGVGRERLVTGDTRIVLAAAVAGGRVEARDAADPAIARRSADALQGERHGRAGG